LDPVNETTPLDRFPGKTLDGFLIEAPLGRGGMAAVFRGRDVALDRLVAIKVLRSQAVRDGSTRDRFLAEARAAASLQHPNIVTTWRAGEMAGVLYIAMQYVNGRTIEKILKHDGRIPPVRALAIAREVCERQGVKAMLEGSIASLGRTYVITLDAINFGSGWFPYVEKRPGLSGYFTVAHALREHFEARGPWSAAELAPRLRVERHQRGDLGIDELLTEQPSHESAVAPRSQAPVHGSPASTDSRQAVAIER